MRNGFARDMRPPLLPTLNHDVVALLTQICRKRCQENRFPNIGCARDHKNPSGLVIFQFLVHPFHGQLPHLEETLANNHVDDAEDNVLKLLNIMHGRMFALPIAFPVAGLLAHCLFQPFAKCILGRLNLAKIKNTQPLNPTKHPNQLTQSGNPTRKPNLGGINNYATTNEPTPEPNK